jgi:hypothetical protein
MTKEDITHLLAVCSRCHRTLPADEMDGYVCDACRDALMEEPARTEWGHDDAR